MKFVGNLSTIEFDVEAYKELLHQSMSEAIAEAAREWLGAVMPAIPVWRGSSRATLIPLASAAKFDLTINPTVRSNFAMGLENADGGITADKGKGEYSFFYSTSLPHLIWNEFNNANVTPDPPNPPSPGKFPPPIELHDPGPYGFQIKGKDAVEQFIGTIKLPLPKFKGRTIKVR